MPMASRLPMSRVVSMVDHVAELGVSRVVVVVVVDDDDDVVAASVVL